MKVATMPEIKD